ncbi:MAG: YfhO family protein [Candidatus Nitrohelix vancouverensis]|uniref:YfhO family protein n=1 Tax=Candidatus Nitrohelix vancouverensis TaxID=2705534 RepID=A0A7T0G3K2_9BACT|nr:MAG: YfhO family protein [Candidatus Nitrohelix vancouverensis]
MTHDSIFWYGNFNYYLLSLANGELPLWDPYSFSGTAFYPSYNVLSLLDPTVTLMVPLIWIFDASALDVYHWNHLLRLFIYYWGIYLLACHISENRWAALLGATFTLFVIGSNSLRQHGVWLSAIYFPFIFLFLLKLFSPRTRSEHKGWLFISLCYVTGISLYNHIPSYLFIVLFLLLAYYFSISQKRMLLRKFPVPDLSHRIIFILKIAGFIAGFFVVGIIPLKNLSYILLILGLIAVLFAIPFYGNRSFLKILNAIGWVKGSLGVVMLLILSGPFFYTLGRLVSSDSEDFGYLRVDVYNAYDLMVHISNSSLFQPKQHFFAAGDYLISALFPFADIRYFMGMYTQWEVVLLLGLVPLILIVCLFKQSQSPYKNLILYLVIALICIMATPSFLYDAILQYFPGYKTIRVPLIFLGYFYVFWTVLLALIVKETFILYESSQTLKDRTLPVLACVFVLHCVLLFLYANNLPSDQSTESILKYKNWVEENLVSNVWLLILAYASVSLFIAYSRKSVRLLCGLGMCLLTLFQVFELIQLYRFFATQPAHYSAEGAYHKRRDFKYSPVRVPSAPRLGTFWAYQAPMFRIPTAGPLYQKDYMIVNKRSFDFIRWVPVENQRVLSGIGAQRFGFFDDITIVPNSMEALKQIANMTPDELGKLAIIERSMADTLTAEQTLNYKTLPPPPPLPELANLYNQLTRLYTKKLQIGFKNWPPDKEIVQQDADPAEIGRNPIPSKSENGRIFLPTHNRDFDLNWPWDDEHLGYFQGYINHLDSSRFSLAYFAHAFLPVSSEPESENRFCFSNKYNDGTIPNSNEEPSPYSPQPNLCAVDKRDNEISISNKLWFISYIKEINFFKENQKEKENLWIISLDPETTTPDASPYARDEPTQVTDFGPNYIKFEINNSKGGLFYYADAYSKDWKAWVDGEPMPVLRANFNYKAVYLEEGSHTLEFKFKPTLFIYIVCIFMMTSIVGLIIPARSLMRK